MTNNLLLIISQNSLDLVLFSNAGHRTEIICTMIFMVGHTPGVKHKLGYFRFIWECA